MNSPLSLLLLSLLLSPALSGATLEQQRNWFVRAEALAHHPQKAQFTRLMKRLKDYPLLPYVELKTLKRYPYMANLEKIDDFLNRYQGTPLDAPLRNKWLQYLARKNEDALFLKYYRDLGNTSLACTRLRLLLTRTPGDSALLDEVDTLWRHGASRPKACDPVFEIWQAEGRLTTDKVWQRLILAADGGQASLIPYLTSLLPEDQRALGKWWLKVRRAPSQVVKLKTLNTPAPDRLNALVEYGLRRLIWRDPQLAINSWQNWARARLSESARQRLQPLFARALASKDHPQAQPFLELAKEQDPKAYSWYLARLLSDKDWQGAQSLLANGGQAGMDKKARDYWQARTLEAMGDKAAAQELYQSLSQERHYYGFLASARSGQPLQFNHLPVSASQASITEVTNMAAMQRAKELLALGRYLAARREWNYLQTNLSREQQLAAAIVAHDWGWHDRTIFSLASSEYNDDVHRRFPLAFQQTVLDKARRHNIAPDWTFAIVRRESAFMPDAHSGAGARGLMQLLPSTANYLSKTKQGHRRLLNPGYNIDMGSRYLRYLMEKMADNPVLATAAYNAGWHRVKGWQPDDEALPADIWIETIPYTETRNYVKAVMAYREIYRHRLGNAPGIFTDLIQMEIPPTNLTAP